MAHPVVAVGRDADAKPPNPLSSRAPPRPSVGFAPEAAPGLLLLRFPILSREHERGAPLPRRAALDLSPLGRIRAAVFARCTAASQGRASTRSIPLISHSALSLSTGIREAISFGDDFAVADNGASVPFITSRLATPDKAAVVDLAPWLSADTTAGWRRPGDMELIFDGDTPPIKGFFRVPAREWRAAVRRTVRTGLLDGFYRNERRGSCDASWRFCRSEAREA